jgi:general secretion pathway protein G
MKHSPMTRKSVILILAGVFGFSLVASVSAYFEAHKISSTNSCLNNLRQIDGAKQQWALEYGKTTNDAPSLEALRPYVGRGPEGDLSGLRCPKGGKYAPGRVGDPPMCSVCGPEDPWNPPRSKSESWYFFAGLLCLPSFLALMFVTFFKRKHTGPESLPRQN